MEDLQLRFNKFLRHEFLDLDKLYRSKFVLAVSGGVDSMVMLDLFRKEFSEEQLVVAHLDHMIRDNSNRDMEVVREYCLENGVQFVGEGIDVKKFPGNLEANGRQVRYNFLEKVRRDYGADWIVTAHHADDQAETIMMASLKGAFVKGLSGMSVKDSERNLLRPMIFAKKDDLYKYARERGVRFVTDESNADNSYDRNFLRNQIFPMLENRFEGFAERYVELANFYDELDEYLWERIDKLVESKCVLEDYGWVIKVKDFLELPGFLRFMLLQKLSGQVDILKMSRANFRDIEDMLERGNSGKKKSIGDFMVYIYNDKILVSRMDEEELRDWYWDRCLLEFREEMVRFESQLVRFDDGMKVEVEYGNERGKKEVALKDFLKQQNVAWFFRKGVPVLLDESGLVEKCWVL